MIKAEHKIWARIVFDMYIKRLFKKHFNGFYLVNDLPKIPDNVALVVTPNHFSWWDGFFIDFTFKKFSSRKLHIMMLEDQLKKYWFFRKVGAYSINREKPLEIISSIRYTKQIITDASNYAVIYPQGEIEPFEKESLELNKGIFTIVNNINLNTYVLPVAFKISYEKEMKPNIYLKFGPFLNAEEITRDHNIFEQSFVKNVNSLKSITYNDKYVDLLKL